MAKSNSSQKVITPKARAAYAFVFKPRPPQQGQSGDPKYSITLIFPKTADLTKLKNAVRAAAENKWGDRYKSMKLDYPFHDGNKERQDEDGKVDALFKNTIYLTARSTERPEVVNEDLDAIVEQREFYSGCYCRASLYAFAYDNSGKRGVSFLLNNIQKLEDGEKLSGRLSAEEEFGETEKPRKGAKPRAEEEEEEDEF